MDSSLTIILGFVILVIIISAIKQYYLRKIQYKERMMYLEKGQTIQKDGEIQNICSKISEEKCAKIKGIIWVSISIGIAAAFGLMSFILQETNILVVCALSLIPFFVGIGYLINSFLLKKT